MTDLELDVQRYGSHANAVAHLADLIPKVPSTISPAFSFTHIELIKIVALAKDLQTKYDELRGK